MRKTQSYQEPSTLQQELKISNVSSSHEWNKPIKQTTDKDIFQLPPSQPLFQMVHNKNNLKPNIPKIVLFAGNDRNPNDENYMVKSTNLNQNKKNTQNLTLKHNQNLYTSRVPRISIEELSSMRPSFCHLRKSENGKVTESQNALLFTKHLKKLQRGQQKNKPLSFNLKFAFRSNKGLSKKSQKVNQDMYIINLDLDKGEKVNFFGICDGHGPYGHHVSGYLKNSLTDLNKQINFKSKVKQQIYSCFQSTQNKLGIQSKIDLNYSGSTLVGCYVCSDRIYCCNVGDSRAIIGSKGQNDNKWSVWQISSDHKPDLKSQAERIIQSQGRIEAVKLKDGKFAGPLRVWLKNQNIPGLAMTRSFGDLVAKRVGVHSQPDITQHFLRESDKIILIASDGVWEFLQNQDIIEKLSPFYQKNQLQEACSFLQQYSRGKWICQNNGQIDDITFILIFLFHN